MTPAGRRLGDVGRKVLIGRNELVPSRLRVAAIAPSHVSGEIFGVDLPSGPVVGDLVQGHASDLEYENGLVAVGGQCGLNGRVERWHATTLPVGSIRFPHRHLLVSSSSTASSQNASPIGGTGRQGDK